MNQNLTLESLAQRVEALEEALKVRPSPSTEKDWHKVLGMFSDSEFMHEVDEEIQRAREVEREQARNEVH